MSNSDVSAPQTPNAQQMREARRLIRRWFSMRDQRPFPFQEKAWTRYLQGDSGLIHATTGTGKTYAAWLGPVLEWLAENHEFRKNHGDAITPPPAPKSNNTNRGKANFQGESVRVVWVTPLRALAQDTLQALQQPLNELGIPWTVMARTGDTSASDRAKIRKRLPTALVTTPESLSLLLSYADSSRLFSGLRCVICDEWHELLSTKRGVQTELAIARLKRRNRRLRIWGLSATLGNTDEAMQVLLGTAQGSEGRTGGGCLIRGRRSRVTQIDSVIPPQIDRFPWAGHLGIAQVREVAEAVDAVGTSLIFTNTRSQTEIWYQALLKQRPDWAGRLALHHGSLDRDSREWVESRLRDGQLKSVVCTSSLDLGVDFSPVERVFQIGSPKGVARFLQRAGRSGHFPGGRSRITFVPTHAFELVEVAAARDAIRAGRMESRSPHQCPIDVLCQHMVTIAAGEGFDAESLRDEVRTTTAYQSLTDADWQWALDFVTFGGKALRAYDDYHKLRLVEGRYTIAGVRSARQHRMSIGTITGDSSLVVKYLKGPSLGTVEESFLSKLKPGDCFTFAGRIVEFVHIREMTVWVRKARRRSRPTVPRWMGGRMPLSTELASAVLRRLAEAEEGKFRGPEMRAVREILIQQQQDSALPRPGMLLIEQIRSREGHHLLLYPFAGRLVHEGMAALFAWRLGRIRPLSFAMSVNDYGLELLSEEPPPLQEAVEQGLFATASLNRDIEGCLNAAEMGKRQFREIAGISGLIFQGYPGRQKSTRQLQAGSELLFDVFSEYDPENRLLAQARREVLERQLEHSRLVHSLNRIQQADLIIKQPDRLTPLSFPLVVERLRGKLSTEKLVDRIHRMQQRLTRQTDTESRRKSSV